MPGETTSGSLSQALPSIIARARIVKEFAGTWERTCDVQRQEPNTGLDWQEFALSQVNASNITETTRNENFQQLSGTLLSVEPTMTQIIIKVTDRTMRKLASVVTGQMGPLAGNAMKRLQDEDYLSLFSTFATTNSPGTGTAFGFGYISSAVTNITSNVTEGTDSPIFSVLHGRQIKDVHDEIVAGVGTYPVPDGMTEEIFRKGFEGMVAGSMVYRDNNITVDSVPDARGATHARDGVVAAIGKDIEEKTDYDMYFGGGAEVASLVQEYAFVERQSGSTQVWCYQHLSDATAPTS